MKIFKNPYFIVLIILLTAVSCVKQNTVDFSQTNDITFKQQTKIGFINFNIDTSAVKGVNSLPISSPLNPFVFVIEPFDIFNNTEFEQHLDLINLHFEIENRYDRLFKVKIDFLDANKSVKYNIALNAPKNTNIQPKTLIDIVVSKADILNLTKTVKANIKISILNNPTKSFDADSFLKIQSGATLFFTY